MLKNKRHFTQFTISIGVFAAYSFVFGLYLANDVTGYNLLDAAGEEKVVSVDIYDFFATLPTEFSTGSTTGKDIEAGAMACSLPLSGKLGHTSGDPSGGFRVNASTLKFTISMSSYHIIGVSGTAYSTSSSGGKLTATVNSTTTQFGNTINKTDFPVTAPAAFARVDVSSLNLTGDVIFAASTSIGLTELVLYYQAP